MDAVRFHRRAIQCRCGPTTEREQRLCRTNAHEDDCRIFLQEWCPPGRTYDEVIRQIAGSGTRRSDLGVPCRTTATPLIPSAPAATMLPELVAHIVSAHPACSKSIVYNPDAMKLAILGTRGIPAN